MSGGDFGRTVKGWFAGRRKRRAVGACIGVAVVGIALGLLLGPRGATTRALGVSYPANRVAAATAPATTPSGSPEPTPDATPDATPSPSPDAGVVPAPVQSSAPAATPAPGPTVLLDPASFDFGKQNIAEGKGTIDVRLWNTGPLPLHVANLSAAGPFQVDPSPCAGSTLNQGQNCPIGIRFAPTQTGPVSGTITVTDDASPPTQTIPVTGVGTSPGAQFSVTSIAFKGAAPGPQTVTITSTGSGNLSVMLVRFSDSTTNFGVSDVNCVGGHAPGTTCTVQVAATGPPPGAGTQYGATLQIYTDAGGPTPQLIPVSWAP